jgi:hypothetical protein
MVFALLRLIAVIWIFGFIILALAVYIVGNKKTVAA